MTDREKVIAAYICINEKLPDKRCEKCPFDYEYLDQTGDNYFVSCNIERIMVDAIDLLKAQEPVEPTIDIRHGKSMWRCGSCATALQPNQIHTKFCFNCGKAVKWE